MRITTSDIGLLLLLLLLENGAGEETLVELSWHQKGSWCGRGTSKSVHIAAQVVGATTTPQLILKHDEAAAAPKCRQHFSVSLSTIFLTCSIYTCKQICAQSAGKNRKQEERKLLFFVCLFFSLNKLLFHSRGRMKKFSLTLFYLLYFFGGAFVFVYFFSHFYFVFLDAVLYNKYKSFTPRKTTQQNATRHAMTLKKFYASICFTDFLCVFYIVFVFFGYFISHSV